MARETKQADSWASVKIWLDSVDKTLANMPAPPTPRDSWSEKCNALVRTVEGMREQVRSEVENEDQRLAEARENDHA